ncbi:MAG TPA: hypothetical protein VHC97_10670 [Thermoanaerobaculia bacterium]|jgi:hypothetical protein|nr:hypothetical protein [Thermoanaerobaculia bacterium]
MKPKRLLPFLLLAVMSANAAKAANTAVDPFYLSLLRDGQAAFDRKDYAKASRDLRLACFGMLDEPKTLADCLARLALAQDRADQVDGFRDTFQRLAEIEDRFKAYSQGDLPAELRASLEQRLAARLPAATLQSAPAFRTAAPARKPEAPAQAVPPAQTSQTLQTSQPPPAAKVPPSVSADPAPAAPTPFTEAERKKLGQARQILAGQRTARELKEAFQLAREVADAHPDLKEAQLLAAEGAYRISRWSDALTYFRRGGDPGENEPERLFYMAVSLYESGDAAGAAAALKRALPNLKRTAYVDSYIHKIQGQ